MYISDQRHTLDDLGLTKKVRAGVTGCCGRTLSAVFLKRGSETFETSEL